MSESRLTVGEKSVGLLFNPSGTDAVYECKRRFADSIDQLLALPLDSDGCRIVDNAIVQIMTAQMWAVKALTWK